MKQVMAAILGVILAGVAHGAGNGLGNPAAEAIRGGWVADVGGVRHIFVFKVRGEEVSGIHCAVDCGDPSRLDFVEQGRLAPEGVRFGILKVDGATRSRVEASGRVIDGQLLLTIGPGTDRDAMPGKLILQRDPRRPAPRTVEELFARRGVTSGPLVISGSAMPYMAPGPNESLSAGVLEGLWLFGSGPGRQHFIFRDLGDGRVLGLACGPCDNPWSFGPIDTVVIEGDTATFDIVHEDWGIGFEYGPFANHATATLSRDELHLRTVQHNGPRTIQGDLVLSRAQRRPAGANATGW